MKGTEEVLPSTDIAEGSAQTKHAGEEPLAQVSETDVEEVVSHG